MKNSMNRRELSQSSWKISENMIPFLQHSKWCVTKCCKASAPFTEDHTSLPKALG